MKRTQTWPEGSPTGNLWLKAAGIAARAGTRKNLESGVGLWEGGERMKGRMLGLEWIPDNWVLEKKWRTDYVNVATIINLRLGLVGVHASAAF